ncbi:hypothetical protein Sste5346_010235 [Sporothrix stenoceras]|uniref:Uncharacterized protein n=1 Tax=Sporothrix stenoceras TaxID=5173 RepID=A0ABR3YHR2_9PEZI
MFSNNKDRNKHRLDVAHYMRSGAPKMPGGEDKFHWALLVGPKIKDKTTRGRRFHAKESILASPIAWEYNEDETGTVQTLRLLTRAQIGKVKDMIVLEEILRSVPIRAGAVEGWNCVACVREVLEMVAKNDVAMATAVLDWTTTKGVLSNARLEGLKMVDDSGPNNIIGWSDEAVLPLVK